MDDIVNKIKEHANNIITEIEKIELNNKEYLLQYKLEDILTLEIRKCQTCGSSFIYHPTNAFQKFCGDKCRYYSTKSKRKSRVSNDTKFRKIDNLRKAIYERKYRARVINKPLHYIEELDRILEELKILQKERKNLDLKTFNQRINILRTEYKQAFLSSK